jgi:hypothetical protein
MELFHELEKLKINTGFELIYDTYHLNQEHLLESESIEISTTTSDMI